MNPWQSIGAVCLNIFTALVQKLDKIDDLVLPLCCGLYLSDNWDKLNFSKTDSIEKLRPHVSQDVMTMKSILINNPENIKQQVNSYLDHLNGSLALSVILLQSLYNGNQSIFQNNLKLLFQESWEVLFWFIQDVEDQTYKSLVCDFTGHHTPLFNQILLNINATNPA